MTLAHRRDGGHQNYFPRQAAGGNRTVLVVDDNGYMLRFLCLALQKAGFETLPASSGEEACRLVGEATREIRLLVTDLDLGGQDGRQVAKFARRERPGLPVLFVSGYPDGDAGHGGLDDGADFLAKPFSLVDLIEKVRSMLGTTTYTPATHCVL